MVTRTETVEEGSGRLVAVNEFVSFVLGVGGFGEVRGGGKGWRRRESVLEGEQRE